MHQLPSRTDRLPVARHSAVSVALALTILLTGCASIMHGTTQGIGVSSSPTNARVIVDNMPLGNTPIVANLKRKDNHTVRIELDGYQPFEMAIARKTSGWVWGNIVFGGLIGLAVDAISGGLYNLTPEQVAAAMITQPAQRLEGSDVSVLVVMQPDPSWVQVGRLERAER